MALGKQITGENGSFVGQYHRVRSVVYDYDREQCHVYIAHYADKQYRDEEKAALAENRAQIARYHALAAKQTLTAEEEEELAGMSIKQLEAYSPVPRSIGTDSKLTLAMGEDVRQAVYDRLGADIEAFEGALDV